MRQMRSYTMATDREKRTTERKGRSLTSDVRRLYYKINILYAFIITHQLK